MAISLYDVTVKNFVHTLRAVEGYLDKAHSHCEANGPGLDEIVETSLFEDMLPFRFQLVSVAHHASSV